MRVPNWPRLLLNTVDNHASSPFSWGRSDCLCMADDVTLAIADTPVSRHPWRGKYTSRAGALKTLKKYGYSSIDEVFADGFPEIPAVQAQRGDLGCIRLDDGFMAAVVCMGQTWAGKSESGTLWLPRRAVTLAYKVG